MTAVLLISFPVLMFAGVPVALAMAGAARLYVMVSGTVPALVVIHRLGSGTDTRPPLTGT